MPFSAIHLAPTGTPVHDIVPGAAGGNIPDRHLEHEARQDVYHKIPGAQDATRHNSMQLTGLFYNWHKNSFAGRMPQGTRLLAENRNDEVRTTKNSEPRRKGGIHYTSILMLHATFHNGQKQVWGGEMARILLLHFQCTLHGNRFPRCEIPPCKVLKHSEPYPHVI